MASSAHPTSLPPLASGTAAPDSDALISLGLYVAIALIIILALLLLTRYLGQHTASLVKNEPYESGIAPSGPARLGTAVPFYLVAIFFIIFDVEIIFIVSWAVAADLLGWSGYLHMVFFVLLLFAGLAYLWREGGLEWGPALPRGRSRGDQG